MYLTIFQQFAMLPVYTGSDEKDNGHAVDEYDDNDIISGCNAVVVGRLFHHLQLGLPLQGRIDSRDWSRSIRIR